MKDQKVYEPTDKLINVISDNYSVLQSLGAFGIPENSSSITFGTTEDIKSSRIFLFFFFIVEPDHSIPSSPATPTTPVSTSQVPVMNYYVLPSLLLFIIGFILSLFCLCSCI